MSEPHLETADGTGAIRFSQAVRFDPRPGRSRVELLAEFALGHRPDHGGNESPADVREALSAYIDVAEWEQVVDRIATEGRGATEGEVLRLSSIVSAQLAGFRQRRFTCEVEALGVDPDLLGEWIYGAVTGAYAEDPEIYEDGYRRIEHLEAVARRRVIAKGYEAIVDHPAVEELTFEEIEHIFELSSQATYVAFNGGGNGEELAVASAHANLLCPSKKVGRPPVGYRARLLRRSAGARRSRGRPTRRRGSRRVARDTGPPGEDPDPEPFCPTGIERTRWEMETTGFGLALGAAAAVGTKGPIIGAVCGWIWGRWRLGR